MRYKKKKEEDVGGHITSSMIQEYEEESYMEMLVHMQPLFNTQFLQKITSEDVDEMLEKAVETAVSLGDLIGGGDQVHTSKAVETLDKPVEVGIHARGSDMMHMPLCQNVYAFISSVYAHRSQLYTSMSIVYHALN